MLRTEDYLTSQTNLRDSVRTKTDLNVLANYVAEKIDSILPAPGEPLHQASHHHFSTKGKLLRASCALLISEAMSVNTKIALEWAVGCELLHNASLVHDDVCDNASLRRGELTVHQKYGIPTAICLGDWLISQSLQHFRNAIFQSEIAPSIGIDCFTQALSAVSLAQSREFDGTSFIDWETYLSVIDGKTTPLLNLAFSGPALLSRSTVNKVEIDRAAKLLGRAFQILNDIDDFKDGHPPKGDSSDLYRRAPNAMIVSFRNSLTGSTMSNFDTWYFSGNTSEVGLWRRKIVNSRASIDCLELARRYVEEFKKLSLGNSISAAFQPLTSYLELQLRFRLAA
jgi:geranylgeranyl pyrophosphate synthase